MKSLLTLELDGIQSVRWQWLIKTWQSRFI